MKKKETLDDLEIFVDPKPLTKEEEIALGLFIRQLKAKKTRRPTAKIYSGDFQGRRV